MDGVDINQEFIPNQEFSASTLPKNSQNPETATPLFLSTCDFSPTAVISKLFATSLKDITNHPEAPTNVTQFSGPKWIWAPRNDIGSWKN